MTALSLLGKSLKDEEIIDILEQFDVDVVYSFDRIHENTPDVYWAAIKSAGFQRRAGRGLGPGQGFQPGRAWQGDIDRVFREFAY
ncbi:hypothetical protein HDC36_002245 [Xanthomonas sp. JAI131]|uniref:hypothetical protein n=1 Tax=Xanthomonas sp. JAI131 TaxID=2723067 RepID=UPI0015CBDA71|nr:hypothetical protein [Xanthomonas sp. JAI131]NYF20784.1 hypothetical protein [Xanthomonas sp. JAI131]